MTRLPDQPWLSLEGSKSAEEFQYHQQVEMRHIQDIIASFFDGYSIRYWDLAWNPDKKCWEIEIYPYENLDIISYYK